MSDLGHIRGDAPQTRAKSRGAEACHCTEIIHVLITPPVCLRMSSAEPLLSLRLSALWSNLCLTQYESLIARRRANTSAKAHSYPYPTNPSVTNPDYAYTSASALELWSLPYPSFMEQAGIMLLNYLLLGNWLLCSMDFSSFDPF